jgi:hypothetical protein
MPEKPFQKIAEKFGSLSQKLKRCTDPAKRLGLLKEFRATLAEADRMIAEESANRVQN